MSTQPYSPINDRLRGASLAKWLATSVKPAVDRHLRNRLDTRVYADHLTYPIDAGGKRWRPGLTILVGRICGVPADALMDLAAGIELLHTFTLVHDDLVDRDTYRRGRPAMWAAYDEPTAINIGDMMFAEAISLIPEDARPVALDTAVQLSEGQQMDLDFCARRNVSIQEYLTMARKKTGSLLDLCITGPQAIAGSTLDLEDFCLLGPAYQIRDDLLDYRPEKGRVAVGNDVRAGKRTLMVVHADDDHVYDILDKPFRETTSTDVETVRSILTDHGSISYAHEQVTQLSTQAIRSVGGFPNSAERTKLEELGELIASTQSA